MKNEKHITKEEIQAWLISALSQALNKDKANIDVNTNFTDIGLDSVTIVEITGNLEDWLGIPVVTTVFWDHKNIAQVTDYLSDTLKTNKKEIN